MPKTKRVKTKPKTPPATVSDTRSTEPKKKLGRKSLLVDAERYEILIDRNLKNEFVNKTHEYSRGSAELIRSFMRAFVAKPVEIQKALFDCAMESTADENTGS